MNEWTLEYISGTWYLKLDGNTMAIKAGGPCDSKGSYQVINGPCTGATITVS